MLDHPFSRIIDLSHPLDPAMPCWPGDPEPRFDPWADIPTHGYGLRRVSMGEHTGTHVNAPAHLLPGGRTIDGYAASELVLPAVVLDVRAKCMADPDAAVEMGDIRALEAAHGPIPSECLVLACTGWDAKWSDPDAFLGLAPDGSMHFPGFSGRVAAFLVRERAALALGIDTHGLDPGADTDLRANLEVARAGGLALECLANLHALPPVGALAAIGVLGIKGSGGAPARVMAFAP